MPDQHEAVTHDSFWWADARYIYPGLWFRRRRIVPVSLWILRPRYSWRTRNV